MQLPQMLQLHMPDPANCMLQCLPIAGWHGRDTSWAAHHPVHSMQCLPDTQPAV